MADNNSPQDITPDLRERLKAIGERDSTTVAEPAPVASSAAAGESPTPAVAPAAPIPTDPAAGPAEDWWNGADVDHTMLRSASGAEVVKMFKHSQATIKAKEEEIKRLKALANPTATPAAPAAPPPPSTDVDPRLAEFELVQFTDAKRAREIQREWAREDALAATDERRAQETSQQRVAATISAARTGMATIAADYGVNNDASLEFRIRTAVLPEMNRFATEQVFEEYGGNSGDPAQVAQAEEAVRAFMQAPESYRAVYAAIYGEPVSAAAKPPITTVAVPERATPTHSMSPAPPNAPRKMVVTKELPPDMDRSLSKLGGLTEEGLKRFKSRVAASA